MEWNKEEDHRFVVAIQCGSDWRQIAAIAVELVAARGGTMTAVDVSRSLESIKHGGGSLIARDLLQHVAAQGARIAELEAERDKARRGGNRLAADVMAWEKKARALESEKEAIRQRLREASNLERLIAEKGIPAAMRWVVDGEEPRRSTATHGDHGGELREAHEETQRHPCSPTCTHDDAATPGHPERIAEASRQFAAHDFREARLSPERAKERSEAFKASCQHAAPTFTPSGCGQCTAEQGRIVPLYSETYGGASPFHPSTEEDWDLSLVEEALAEKPDSAVSNGALYWRRRFLKIVDRLGWVDPQTLSAKTNEARDEGAEAMRAACIQEARAFWEEEGVSQVLILRMIGRLEGATP